MLLTIPADINLAEFNSYNLFSVIQLPTQLELDMIISRVFFSIVLLAMTGICFCSRGLAGDGKSETVIPVSQVFSGEITSEQESFSVYRYPLYLFKRLREVMGEFSPFQSQPQPQTQSQSIERKDNYPWAVNPYTCNPCQRKGCTGCFHRYRKWLKRIGLTTYYIGCTLSFICLGGDFITRGGNRTLNKFFSYGDDLTNLPIATGGIAWIAGTFLFPTNSTVRKIYQCNHRECIETPRLEDTDTIDEELRCPGDRSFLLHHPVVISGYDRPLSLEFVMQCIRDKTPFPEGTSPPVTWNRMIKWNDLPASLQEQIKVMHAKSLYWLQINKPLNTV